MIDKSSGKIAYAVLTFGGFLRFGRRHFPVPWEPLKYNIVRKAYEVEIADDELRAEPLHVGDQEFDWGDRPGTKRSQKVYRTAHYWE